jgi:protein-disulfide isomerase
VNKLTTNNKVAIIFTAVMIAAIAVLLVIATIQADQSRRSGTANSIDQPLVSVIDDSTHLLDDAPGSTVTVVEFLDFECEACGAMYPVVEEARAEYAGDVTFAFRYFPLPGHLNSTNAAIAVEAAARQDRLPDMYARMFETQAEWGELQESRAPLFRTFAEDLGLDMARYDADVAAPETAARVKYDFDAARTLGLTSTPSFFVNDQPLELTSVDDLGLAIDAALAQ